MVRTVLGVVTENTITYILVSDMLIYWTLLILMGDIMAKPKDLDESQAMMRKALEELEMAPDEFVEPEFEQTSGVPMRLTDDKGNQMVRGPQEFTPEGFPTFQFNTEDPLHNILQKSALDAGAIIDITGADRSAKSSAVGKTVMRPLSEDRHSFGGALDIGVNANPSYFSKKGEPTEAGEQLIRNLLESGEYRLFAGPDKNGQRHLHIDKFGDEDERPDNMGRLYQEGGGDDSPMMEAIKRIESEMFMDEVSPELESLADKIKKRIEATPVGNAKAPPKVDPFS